MKVVDVVTQVLKAPEYPHGGWVLVRVRTDDGVEGVGECFVPDREGRGVFAARDLIDGSLKRAVVGEEVLDIEKVWEGMYGVCRSLYDRRGMAIHALSGVDMALYDAAGKTLGIPVHRLLGGRFRDRVRVYVSSIWVDPENPDTALAETGRVPVRVPDHLQDLGNGKGTGTESDDDGTGGQEGRRRRGIRAGSRRTGTGDRAGRGGGG